MTVRSQESGVIFISTGGVHSASVKIQGTMGSRHLGCISIVHLHCKHCVLSDWATFEQLFIVGSMFNS